MFNLNNKGQSLVLFILLIPILLGIMVLVIDIGNAMYYRKDLDNINKLVIDYGIDHINDDNVLSDMKELAKLNNKKISIEIRLADMEFYAKSSYYVNGIFSNIFNTRGYLVKSEYKGYKDKNKNVIKRLNNRG